MNAVLDQWINCWTKNGVVKKSPIDILRDKGDIIEPVGSAQDIFSVIRFLTVLAVSSDWVDGDWESYLEQNSDCFELFEDKPFLQVESKEHASPVGKLFSEIPSCSSINFTSEIIPTKDGEYVVCTSCATYGMLRFNSFTPPGGVGYQSGINNVPPYYCLRWENSLKEIISLNLPKNTNSKDLPLWHRKFKENNGEIGDLEAMTFQSRFIQLLPEINKGHSCRMCGQVAEIVVRNIHFNPGRDKMKVKWTDPFVIRTKDDRAMTPKSRLAQGDKNSILDKAADLLEFDQVVVFGISSTQAKVTNEFIIDKGDDIEFKRRPKVKNFVQKEASDQAYLFVELMSGLSYKETQEVKKAKINGLQYVPQAGKIYENFWRKTFRGQGKKKQSLAVFLNFNRINHKKGSILNTTELTFARRNLKDYLNWASNNRSDIDWAYLLQNI